MDLERLKKLNATPASLEEVQRTLDNLSELIRRKMVSDEADRQELTRKLLGSEEARGKLFEQLMNFPRYARLGRAYNNKGITLLNLEIYEEALHCFDEAIKTDPSRIYYNTNKGLALEALGRSEEALVCFDKVINKFSLQGDIQEKGMDYSGSEDVKKVSRDTEMEMKYWQNKRTVNFVHDYTRKREISKLDDWIPDSSKPISVTIKDIMKDFLSNYTRPEKMTRNIYHKVYMLKRWNKGFGVV